MDWLCASQSICEIVDPPFVHEKPDGATVHSKDGNLATIAIEHFAKRVEHEPIASEREQNCRLISAGEGIAGPQQSLGLFGNRGMGRKEANPAGREVTERSFARRW